MNIYLVCVLHKIKISQSVTLQSIKKFLPHNSGLNLKLIIWDNSKERQADEEFEFLEGLDYQYICAGGNFGLAKAYNYCLYKAKENNVEWIITCDQDSQIDDFYFNEIMRVFREGPEEETVAVVPRILNKANKLVAPAHTPDILYRKALGMSDTGYHTDITTINSCSMLNVEFVAGLGGFNNLFWLGTLDIWLFTQIIRAQKKVYVTEALISQDFASDGNISKFRRNNIIISEAQYIKLCEPKKFAPKYVCYQIKTMIYHLTKEFNLKKASYAFITIIKFIFMSRKKCIKLEKSLNINNRGVLEEFTVEKASISADNAQD